jgi:2-oxoglutarate ferredoxin oxidoreductase subunit beta
MRGYQMKKTADQPRSLKKNPFRYCPGCGHIIIHRLIAEVVDELNIRERTIGIAPVGCAVFAYDYFDFDMLEAAHGRPPAAATGMKRVRPDCIVFSYQGDGDLASIGTAEIIHAASRGENISVFFVNNATYGMTGGQMAPTTLPGQITTTTPTGRDTSTAGYPLHVAEMLATLEGPSLIARTSTDSPASVKNTRDLIERSFRCQMENKGFSMIEILSACPTNWNLTPAQSAIWMREKMMDVFRPGVFKDATRANGTSG